MTCTAFWTEIYSELDLNEKEVCHLLTYGSVKLDKEAIPPKRFTIVEDGRECNDRANEILDS